MISYSKCYCLFKQYIMLSSISLKTMSLPIFYIFSGSPLTSSLKRCSQWYIRWEQGPSSISCITSNNVLDNLPLGLSVMSDMKIGVDNKQHHVLSCHLDLIPSLETALFNTLRSKVTSQYIMIWNDSRILAFFHLWIDFSNIIQIHIVIVWS